MSTNNYRSFAVAGVGNTVGLPIVNSLLARNVSVVVLSRSSSNKTFPVGTKVVSVDYSDLDTLTAVLRENAIDVVISTLAVNGLDAQYPLADAAKAAGVKLFVPSEFGAPTGGATEGIQAQKGKFAGKTLHPFATGLFQELVPRVSGVQDSGKFLILGNGDTPLSLTAIPDVGEYLAHVLTTLAPEQLNNVELRIEGQRATFRELAELYKGKLPTEFVDSIPKDLPLAGIMEWLQRYAEMGAISTGYDSSLKKDDPTLAGSANKLYPGYKFRTVKETLGL
ncbi:hypothetical protein ID866_360 [Astraeus odoratus]|nr:hypothetical protein ID866_360 [Astraeus odoratus]